ncbi:MAG: hypothetical protein Q4F84_07865, partial [Fibrobacter sp.]|nr:hypothetical protein [Fibrobacter sp.]
IEQLISQIERNETIVESFVSSADIEEKLVKNFIPNMLYARMEPKSFQKAAQQFRSFMSGYRFRGDVDAIIAIISNNNENLSQEDYKLLELYAKKIASVKNEDFGAAENYNREIQKYKNGEI